MSLQDALSRARAGLADEATNDTVARLRLVASYCTEPRLDELLDDPIMSLLWEGDGLEPTEARAAVFDLREMLRRRDEVEEAA